MNPLERTLLLKAVTEHVASVKRASDAEVKAMFDPGDRKTVRRDGERLGTITLSEPKPAWKVTDRRAFTAWVAEHYPDAIVTEPRVVPAWEAEYLKNPVTVDGEVPAGVDVVTATPAFTVKPDPGALAALLPDLPRLLEIDQ